jgi:hypothetical protein
VIGDDVQMKTILALSLFLAEAATAPLPSLSPPPLNADQQQRVECVAALAIAAGEQQRGAPGWERIIWLPARGAHFAGLTGDAIMKETGRTRDAVRAELMAAVQSFQSQALATKDGSFMRARVEVCITLMDKLDPPPPPPSLVQCTAMVSLAESEARSRGGASKEAIELANIAAILEAGARKELREGGKSGTDSDVILGLEKDRITALSKENQAKGLSDDLDFESCFKRAGELQRARAKRHG